MHVDCRRARLLRAGRRLAQGRPLGFMLAFLACGHEHPSKALHEGLSIYTTGRRTELRAQFEADAVAHGYDPMARLIIAAERPRRAGEPVEPIFQP